MRNKGFTLIELLITIAIIGILAGGAITAYIGVTLKAARSEAYSNLESLYLLEEQRKSDTGDYTADSGTCDKDNPDNIDIIRCGPDKICGTLDDINALRGFKPTDTGSYSYCIENNIDLAGAAQDPCFRASAYGNSNSRVLGDLFMIDCNNTRNF